MCIFFVHFGFLNFDLGGRGVQIRNQRLHKLPSTECHPNQITFSILVRHIRSGGPSCPKGKTVLYLPLLYIKYIIKLPNVYQKIQKRLFNLAIHLDTFIYKVIGGLVGSVVAYR